MKMKGMVRKMFVLAVGVIVFVLIAGCQESATGGPTNAKKSRLIAAENIELKKQLTRCDKQIGKLKEQHSKEIKRQEELLAKCQEEKKLRQEEKTDESVKEQMDELSTFIIELNAKLQDENESLKAQIEELKKELAELKKEAATQQSSQSYTDWISKCIKRCQTIQKGTTRGELLEVFTIEGGLSTRSERKYVYKECPYIKVDVHFKAVDDEKQHENPGDVITKISKPYLEWSIMN